MAALTLAGLQAEIFDLFNANGSEVRVRPPEGGGFNIGLVDKWEVLRIAQHAGGGGTQFWVVWRQVGFLEGGMHYIHVTRFVRFEKTESNLLLTRDDGTIIQVDFIGGKDRDEWDSFQREKEANAERYESYYRASRPNIEAAANSPYS